MLVIRPAERADCALIVELIKELAIYEKMEAEARATPELIEESLFAEHPNAFCQIATWEGQPAGFALYFFNFSTFIGKNGLYLEDLFVRPHLRGRGIGKALLVELARTAKKMNCGRMEWSVLDWNEPAIQFYKSIGARPMDEWTVYRLDEISISNLSDSSSVTTGQ